MQREDKRYSIWVNWKRRIVSFQKAEGFEELQYPTHEDMFQFVIAKGFDGFGIQ